MENISKQADEMEALSSIYGTEWKIGSRGERGHSIEITRGTRVINLCFTIPENYPTSALPMYDISAPNLSTTEKETINTALDEIFIENYGETMLFQCIEKVREVVENFVPELTLPFAKSPTKSPSKQSPSKRLPTIVANCPIIVHGETIEDRKSCFQAHVATLKCEDQVNVVLQTLKRERKIAEAAHNILAWRCGASQDCDDDGEKGAGPRLIRLLQMLHLNNVIVVVTRWYGGVHLGPCRFRHINNAARQALVQSGLINK